MVAKNGDNVKVHYTGTLDDGSEFDSSRGREPLEFTLGAGSMIPGFEAAVLGMKLGEVKTVTIPAAEAYGEYSEDNIQEIDRSNISPDVELEVGMQLQGMNPNGSIFTVTVLSFTDTTVTLDGNHHLAGEDLTFEIELVEIN